jgi:hypothetical protein
LRRIARACAAALLLGASVIASAACPPAATTKASLQALKAADWSVADDTRRQALAIALADCLASPDPVLRDGLAFEALSYWMRARLLAPTTLQTLRLALLPQLRPEAVDAAGFRQPFAALALSELARVDRLEPYLSSEERAGLVRAATAYLASVRDYRGFDAKEGWRHGVAHASDLLLQLAINPAVDKSQLAAILAAIAGQAMPPGDHFYVYGEGERLARPVFETGRRGVFSSDEWSAWFAALSAAQPRADPPTQATLAARHDLAQFLRALYASLRENGTPDMQARMLPGLTTALKALD